MSKKYIFTVLAVSIFFMGGYLVWTTWVNPRPTNAGDVPQQSAAAQVTPSANVTIVPAALNAQGIPEKLGSLSLTQSMTGKEALSEIAQLHGEGFDLTDGYMSHYGKDQALLWVGQTKDNATAQRLLDEMAIKIGPDNKMFTNLQPLDISGRTLYSANGQGQQHFFYAVSDKIVWIAADPQQAPEVLHSLWSAIK